jgi:ribosomal-protein-alanine N-acetyltransferase
MFAALQTGYPLHLFAGLELHRIEAACIPDNARSIRLLEKAGFQREGYLRGYLKINGQWHDHVMFSLLSTDTDKQENRQPMTLTRMLPFTPSAGRSSR